MYPLMEKQYVQMGGVSCQTEWEDAGRLKVTVLIRQHEFLDSYECIYEETQDHFAHVDLPQQKADTCIYPSLTE